MERRKGRMERGRRRQRKEATENKGRAVRKE